MMRVTKHIVTDENQRPVAVQIEYADWLKIEEALQLVPQRQARTDVSKFVGTLRWDIDGVEYQRRLREEWPE